MHRQTLALREKVFGGEHPSTLTSMSNLAGERPIAIGCPSGRVMCIEFGPFTESN